jgi:hypothetical protein
MSTPTTELPIDCHENSDGSMRCVWKDDNDQEHALYYSRDKEYLHFDQVSRHWLALLNGIHVLSTGAISRSGAQSARALGASPRAGLDTTEWELYQLYIIHEQPKKNKGAWIDSGRVIHYLEWDPSAETPHYDKGRKVWYPIPSNL